MSAQSVFKMAFLSMIAATGLFVASNGSAAEALRQVNETTRIGGNRSDNEIRADEITIPLLTPCIAVGADLFHLTQEGIRWKRFQTE